MSDDYLKSLNLTPQELNKVLYHRANLARPGRDAEGNIVTIYATGIEIPEGKYKGQFVSVPGFVDGKIIEDEQELWKRWQKEIEDDKWPIYPDAKTLNARDEWLHQIMDRDVSLEPDLMYKDPFAEDY